MRGPGYLCQTANSHVSRVMTAKAKRERGADFIPGIRPIKLGKASPPALTCQWIEGEATKDDSCKCGLASMPGRSYCEEHYRRAYVEEDPKALERWLRWVSS